jgi:hypothetical protein
MDPAPASFPVEGTKKKAWKKTLIYVILGVAVAVGIAIMVWQLAFPEKKEDPKPSTKPAASSETKKSENTSTTIATVGNVTPTSTPTGNLVKNGTFDSPTIPADKPSLYRVPTDWIAPPNSNDLGNHMMLIGVGRSGNKVWDSPAMSTPQYLILQSNAIQGLRLDETGIDVGPYVEQTIMGLTVNRTYKVSLAAMLRPTSPQGSLTVLWDDIPIQPMTLLPSSPVGGSPEPYGPYNVIATSTSHKLRIIFTGPRGRDCAGFIENVSVLAA